jgi:hypothetical protein
MISLVFNFSFFITTWSDRLGRLWSHSHFPPESLSFSSLITTLNIGLRAGKITRPLRDDRHPTRLPLATHVPYATVCLSHHCTWETAVPNAAIQRNPDRQLATVGSSQIGRSSQLEWRNDVYPRTSVPKLWRLYYKFYLAFTQVVDSLSLIGYMFRYY